MSSKRLLFAGEFQQGWLVQPEANFMSATGRICADGAAFYVDAELFDKAIGNSATQFNQRTWELGDVFEIFIQTNEERYYEFHITPENQHLFVQWTPASFAAFRGGKGSLDDALIKDPNILQSSTQIDREAQVWTVHARIPFASIEFDPGISHPHLKMALCRYDTTPGEPEPVLSATPPFPQANYHNRAAWHAIAI